MLVIRLFRVGKRNRPSFRIVVTDKKNPPSAGRFLEILGFYNPLSKDKKINAERVKYWISVGAKPSETAHNLLVSEKIIEGKKIPSHKKKKGGEPSSAPVKATEGKEKPQVSAGKPAAETLKAEEVAKKEPAASSEEASLAPLGREKEAPPKEEPKTGVKERKKEEQKETSSEAPPGPAVEVPEKETKEEPKLEAKEDSK